MHTNIVKRAPAVLAVAAICIRILVAGSPAYALTQLNVGKSLATNFAMLTANVGMTAGIFQKHGLTLNIIDFHGGAKLVQGVAAGAVDIALGSGPQMAFVAKGAPEMAVAAFANPPRTIMLVVNKVGPIKTLKDLKGRTISCSTAGSLTNWLGHELSRHMGWGANGINIKPLGGMAAQTAALKTHQIDGMIVESTTAFRAEEAGFGTILVRFGDRYKNFIVHVIFASNRLVAKHPEEIRAFLAAWFETVDYMNSHRQETIKIAEEVNHVSASIATKSYDELMPMLNRKGNFDRKGLALLAQSFVDLHILPEKPDMSKLYTEKFLPASK